LNGTAILAPHQVKRMPNPIIVTSIIHAEAITRLIRSQALPNAVITLQISSGPVGQQG
jgi:hypothetical protein